jgi:hypothetical protein
MRLYAILLVLLCAPLTAGAAETGKPNLSLSYPAGSKPVAFAADRIRKAHAQSALAAEKRRESVTSLSIEIIVGRKIPERFGGIADPAALKAMKPQSYSIRRIDRPAAIQYVVLGADDIGAMYGGLDLAEAIEQGAIGDLRDSDHAPYIEQRGIKFNIPLDARTPSYSDNSDAAQQNIPEMWSAPFWHAMLDEMARHRYNVLTLWSLHPFPSLVKVPEYPDVALDDVMRTTLPMDDTFSHSGDDMVRPPMLEHLEVVKKMTIDEKIAFWRDVMQYAKDRGIDVYLFTWNTFTFGATGKYGITPALDNEKTIAYFRASVRELVLTYPLLAGIGITAGENMPVRKDGISKERWLWRTYGEGVRDALKRQPDRKVRLIHRFHMTGQDEILREFKDYPGPLDLSFKYAIAHMYSTPNPPFIKTALPHLGNGLRTWLTVRNDDIYSFRWGDPRFAREFVKAIPGPDKVAGFYMGPDGYTWGREFLSTEPETPRELVIQKQWYSFMLWGRLSYEPDLPDELFCRTLAARFPEVPAGDLFAAWSAASKVFPQITRFFWGDIDLRWLPEANLSHPRHKGWYTVRHYIEGYTMPESGILNIREWREKVLADEPMKEITPLQVADSLEGYGMLTLNSVGVLRRQRPIENKELRLTLGDLEAMAHLGNYYALKIRGACDLALFDRTGKPEQQASAVRYLEAALEHWKKYAAVYSRQYRPALYNRVGFVNIPALTEKVKQDITIAREWKPGTISAKIAPPGADTPFRK